MPVKKIEFGFSASEHATRDVLEAFDYVEIKTITPAEARRIRALTGGKIFFHIQYSGDGGYYLPAAMEFAPHMKEIAAAYEVARPVVLSIHFGLSSRRVHIDTETYVAVADEPPFERDRILSFLEGNLRNLRDAFPGTPLLIENVEFIPEAASGGAYRHVQEASFFSAGVNRWHETGILDGIVFDVAHAIIAAGNHPHYNGLGGDPIHTDARYIRFLQERHDIFSYFRSYISRMPLHLVREIHISGATRLENGMWVDSHREVGERELETLKILLEELEGKGVEYLPVTLEYSRDMQNVIPQLTRLRNFFNSNA